MSIRNSLMCACMLVGVTASSLAWADELIIHQAPPAPREESIPEPRSGYSWSPGYWKWEDSQHVWVEGHWVESRPNAHWVPDRWEKRDGDWRFDPGHWTEEHG